MRLSRIVVGLIFVSSFSLLAQPMEDFDGVVLADPNNSTIEEHEEASKKRFLMRMGLSDTVLAQAESYFADRAQGKNPQAGGHQASECIADLNDTDSKRNQFFLCVLLANPKSLDTEFFSLINGEKNNRVRSREVSPEAEKTIAFLAYLEDLVRAVLHKQGQSASWYSNAEKKFMNWEDFHDFPFEDGDVVLSMGGSWISGMITQSTYPQKKYSHAFMVRVDENGFRTMEAIIESGVISKSFKKFKKEELNGLLVLRWQDEATRKQIAPKAADLAMEWVDKNVAYDIEMDMQSEDKLFCSELVARAYSEAAGTPLDDFTAQVATVRSDAVFEILKLVGVTSREMTSPGDLVSSPQLEIVGEWRPQNRLLDLWEKIFMADVFIERLEMNFGVFPQWGQISSWVVIGLDIPYWLGNRIIGSDRNLIPASFDKASLQYVITIQKGIFDPAIKDAKRLMKKRSIVKDGSLLSVAPWDLRGYLSYATQENFRVKSVFYDPKNPPFPQKTRARPDEGLRFRDKYYR